MAVAVVDLLEVVDVDQAEHELGAAPLRGHERVERLALELAAILEAGQAVGRRLLLRDAVADGRALVEREGEERCAEQHHERGRQAPEDDGLHRDEDHDREDRAREPEVIAESDERRALCGEADRDADEHHVGQDEQRARADDGDREDAVGVAADVPEHEHRERGQAGGERVGGAVEDDLQRLDAHRRHREADRGGAREHRPLPAEQHLAGDDEDERERDEAAAARVDRHRPPLRQRREREEHRDPEQGPGSGIVANAAAAAQATTGTPATQVARTYQRTRGGSPGAIREMSCTSFLTAGRA